MNYSTKSLRRFPSLDRERGNNLTLHMFVEDLQAAIMPIGGRSQNHPDFKVEVTGPKENFSYVEKLLNSICRHDHHEFKRTLCDAVQEIASRLIYDGQCHYELTIDQNDHRQKYLCSFTSKRLLMISPFYIQFVPRNDWRLHGKWINFIHSRHVWNIKFPTILRSAHHYKKILRRLTKYNRHGPRFWTDNLELHFNNSVFEFPKYVKKADIFVQRLTRDFGWDRRSPENKTEFFQMYQNVTLHATKALIREHIIENLNKLLATLGYNCKIVVTGIPTSNEIFAIRVQLLDGTINFAAVNKTISLL